MKAHPLRRIFLASAAVCMAVSPSGAVELNPLKWFKEKEQVAPDTRQRQAQEAAAAAMMRDAKQAAATGATGRAQDIYKSIVKQYPFTDGAGEAQFEYARLLRRAGKFEDSFEAFQKFIDNYRQNTRFAEAIQNQFEIAEESRTGKHSTVFIVIPAKIGTSDILKMYNGVIKNAPFSKFAPLAQFAIGELYQDKGDKALAEAAFQQVVENYPNTKQASEAQFRLGAIGNASAKRTQDAGDLVRARDALEIYKATHPTGERISEVESQKRQNLDISAQRSLEVAKFYERTGKAKAAAIYYNEALKFGSGPVSVQARERLAALSAAHPEDVKENTAIDNNDYTIPAAMNLKNRADYAGPPVPELARLGQKTKMRVERDDFKPIPLKEPELPTRPSTPPAPGMLIPPAPGDKEKTLLLPIPPAPGMAPPNAAKPALTPPTPAPPAAGTPPAADKPAADAEKKN
jgi:outer membrane protein assembly factor BamD (BamD/ComL family)